MGVINYSLYFEEYISFGKEFLYNRINLLSIIVHSFKNRYNA